MSPRWKRRRHGSQSLVDESGREIGVVMRMDYDQFWYAYLWGNEYPDGIRFRTAAAAKSYVLRVVAKNHKKGETQ